MLTGMMRKMCARSSTISRLSKQSFHSSPTLLTNYKPLGSHRDTPDNTMETYFDFTKENYQRVEYTWSIRELYCFHHNHLFQ